MRIGIDAHILHHEHRGIGKYVLRLVKELGISDRQNAYIIYGPSDVISDLKGFCNFTLRVSQGLPYPLWEQCVLPWWAKRDRLDLLHCPANTAPRFLPSRTRLVVTLHDVMFLLPSSVVPTPRTLRQRVGKAYRKMVVPGLARRADLILTDSGCSKVDIVQSLRVDPSIVRVIYLGADILAQPPHDLSAAVRDRIGIGPEACFILTLGGHDPRKNTERVIRSYAALVSSGKVVEKLVVVGISHGASSPFLGLSNVLGVGDNILFAGFVSDADLTWFYRHARCFLYPSLYEGFGFPPLEAMAAGTPVVASRVASIPEIVGDAALLVDPTSTQSIQEGLLRVLHDEMLRQTLIERGRKQVARFRWESTAAQTLAAYRELLG